MSDPAQQSPRHPSPQPWIRQTLEAVDPQSPFVLCTVLGPREHPAFGRHLLYGPEGTDDLLHSGILAEDRQEWGDTVRLVRDRCGVLVREMTLRLPRDSAGGTARVLFAYYGPSPEVWIFGGGHIGRALTPLLKPLGWRVVVCDDRAEFVTPERFPEADALLTQDFGLSARACVDRPDSWAVLVTRGHLHDERILREFQMCPPRYIGMIGSKRRVRTVRERLRSDGFSETFLSSLCSPIGLPIGADSPAEIAVAIVAEMVALRRGRRWDRDRGTMQLLAGAEILDADTAHRAELWRDLVQVVEAGRPVVLATVVERRGSTPRGPGAQMAVFADGRTMGTIGGGCGEGAVLKAAREMILAVGDRLRIMEIDLTGDDAADATDVCGGWYTIFLELVV